MNAVLEEYLWLRIRLYHEGRVPQDVIQEMVDAGMIISAKQAWRTLEKWYDAGLYEFGVRLDLGWRVQESREKKRCTHCK